MSAYPCASNPDLWFSEDPSEIKQAQSICAGCPFAPECASKATEATEEYGVWGGVNMEDRQEDQLSERREARHDRNATVQRLREDGHSVRQIAAKVGLSKSMVSKMLQAA